MFRNEILIWTALPNGHPLDSDNQPDTTRLALSVFMSPRLSTDESPLFTPQLSLFPDFADWPTTIGANAPGPPTGISFTVTLGPGGSQVTVPARITNVYPNLWTQYPNPPSRAPFYFPNSQYWQLMFDPATTAVEEYQPTDYSSLPYHTFDEVATEAQIASFYKNMGLNCPTAPPVMTGDQFGALQGSGPVDSTVIEPIQQVARNREYNQPINQATNYYNRPPSNGFSTTPTTLDFHQAVSALGSYPILLRYFGLAFDLTIDRFQLTSLLDPGTASVVTGEVYVTPTWTSLDPNQNNDLTIVNATPATYYMYFRPYGSSPASPPTFVPEPYAGVPPSLGPPDGSFPDYMNGMLNLLDGNRFSVTDLDVDGASQQVSMLSTVLATVQAFQEENQLAGQQMSLALPNLRSSGPAVVWSGWAANLMQLLANQSGFETALQNFVTSNGQSGLPIFHAEDIIRGHRFDVYTAAGDLYENAQSQVVENQAWWSLLGRVGAYAIGDPTTDTPATLSLQDEGVVVPGASQSAVPTPTPPPDLYIHEEIARWTGWSLAAPRVGGRIGSTGQGDGNDLPEPANGNPAAPQADNDTNLTPQLSATFTVPPGTLPKLRFGNNYQFRARAADLAGNGPPPKSTDSSFATPVFTHYRYQPVPPPVVVPTDVLTPGQGVMLAALLDYSDASRPVEPLGRWLIPPRGSQLLAEEHGLFDGFVLGDERGLGGPSGDMNTWNYIAQADQGTLLNTTDGTPGAQPLALLDPSTNTPYFYTDLTNIYGEQFIPTPVTAWLPDPLSEGVALTQLPGWTNPYPLNILWNGVPPWTGPNPWPVWNPIAVVLQAGSAAGTSLLTTQGLQPQALIATLPPAGSYNVHISSRISDDGGFNAQSGADVMGIFQWITAGQTGTQLEASRSDALKGMWWLLSPYHTLRMVHAVRIPIGPSQFEEPKILPRTLGSTKANIVDTQFSVDAVLPGDPMYGASTGSVDVQAVWTDPLDDPSDPSNFPDSDTVTTTFDAFKLSIPDPNPPEPADDPGKVLPAPDTLAILSSPGVAHDFGDTKYHSVTYTATATSRFAEFFRSHPEQEIDIPAGASGAITTPLTGISVEGATYGVDPGSLRVHDANGNDIPSSDYSVNAAVGAGTITLSASWVSGAVTPTQGTTVTVSWIPAITLEGLSTTLPVLSSARPKPPKILRVVPAWQITPASGTIVEGSGAGGGPAVTYSRKGGYLRVYLDRPWWSSGADELLGVVMPPKQYWESAPPPDPVNRLVTQMGFDPISVADKNLQFDSTPQFIVQNAQLPQSIPGRSGYLNNIAQVSLQEDSSANKYYIYPQQVKYDYATNQWYSDIEMQWFFNAPPPGYFVRLSLVRFQPYSEPGLEVSTVALATFAQPVSDRSVTVTQSFNSELVDITVTGPAYEGFRPAPSMTQAIPTPRPTYVRDLDNQYSTELYSRPLPETPLLRQTSAMVADFQYQPANSPLPSDLAWQPCSGPPPGGTGTVSPVLLEPTFDNDGNCTWTGTAQIPVLLAGQSGSRVRLRISELDYYQYFQSGQPLPEPPVQVDTTMRRPFVCHIPISTLPQP